MTLRGRRTLAAAVLLLGAAAARGQEPPRTVAVQGRPGAFVIVSRDTFIGGLLGAAIAGGVIAYETHVDDRNDYDWGRALGWGAGAGAAAGLLFGIADASTGPATYARIAAAHDGWSALEVRRRDGIRRVALPLLRGRF